MFCRPYSVIFLVLKANRFLAELCTLQLIGLLLIITGVKPRLILSYSCLFIQLVFPQMQSEY